MLSLEALTLRMLTFQVLTSVDLTSAKLHHSILVGLGHLADYPNYEDADFKDAIIDDERLAIHLNERRAEKCASLSKK